MKALTSLIFIAISVGLFFWCIEPAWASLNQMQSQISQYQSDIVQAQKAQTEQSQLISQYDGFSQDQIQQVQNFLPASIDPIKYVIDLDAIVSQYSSGLDSLAIGSAGAPTGGNSGSANNPKSGVSSGPGYGILPISFSISTTYSNFFLFLRDLERNLPPTDITSLSFSPPQTGDTYTFSVSVQTYYLQ